MLKVYTSNVVTSQRICKKKLIAKKIKKSTPFFNNALDIISAFIFLPFLVVLFSNYYSEFKNHEFFKLKKIEIEGLSLLTDHEVIKLLKIKRDISICDLEFSHIRARLLSSPVINNFKISRKYPDTLFLNIEERIPFIQLKSSDKYILFDHDFNKILTLNKPYKGLFCAPVNFGGDSFVRYKNNENLSDLRLFFSYLQENFLIGKEIILDIKNNENLELFLSHMDTNVLFGSCDFGTKFEKLKRFLSSKDEDNLKGLSIDLRFKEMIIVN